MNKENLENSKKCIEESEIAQIEMAKKYQIVDEEFSRISLELKAIKDKNVDLSRLIEKEKQEKDKKIFYANIKSKLCKKCELKIQADLPPI